ncbi:hypothetical protein M5W83_13550 [Paenibacillus thiaminolyticus]|uniref:Uncharacterized protein n=1 Tax=Paenibacillus thiaminolyticus TaxID=49283 RepID=A0AAP9J295_PANTH|nr:hypothetical protein [Paenibacillus thiaminolyticus]MCY9534227.1 hypothetical protein [Paenibacillus thiaminolyticus]MCY9599958.1 hypothetical protein [Paenibacillus thiaminolyticus]MCY9608168.1 hypothetical protein [Paenibacillus thiaminolyticus]MCY9615925.1 hypothetical protein [Paenibacillus thiaminolyticus]MCY9618336.1 hypothetical protein [Paenibacillus thiaminolyticus]
MNRTAGVLKMHLRDKWTWICIPWGIMLFSFIINLVIGLSIEQGNKPFYTAGIASIYVFMFIAGTFTLAHTFPYALGMNIRRQDYMLGTIAMSAIISAGTSLLLAMLTFMESLSGGWGVRLHFFQLPYWSDGPVIQQIGMAFLLLMHLYYFGFAISSVHRRYRAAGMYVLIIVSFAVLSVLSLALSYYEGWKALWDFFLRYSAWELVLMTVPFTVVYALISFVLVRRSTI